MPGQSALPDLLVEIAFTPDPMGGYLRVGYSMHAHNPSIRIDDLVDIPDYTIEAGDCLEYDIYWEGAQQGIAFEIGPANSIVTDQNGLSSHYPTDISAYANGQWYHRKFPLDIQVGFTQTQFLFGCHQGNLLADGVFFARFRNIFITDGSGTIKQVIWQRPLPGSNSTLVSRTDTLNQLITIGPTSEAPNWTDVTPYVRGGQIRRGKGADLEPTSPGTLSLELDNDDRRFDPSNTASPYYPNLIPGRRVRVSAIKSATTYRRFTGFIKSVPPQWQGRHSIVAIEAVDAFDLFGAKEISQFRAVEQSGARIGWVLDQASWPTADRALDVGLSQVEQSGSSTGTLLDNVSALEHIQDVADAELGDFFIDGAGIATFRQRSARYAQFSASQGVYSNAPGVGEFLYTDWSPSFEEDAIFNEIHVRPIAASTDSIASDYDSQTKYGPRTLSRTVWLTTLTEALNQAEFLLAGRKQPALQINSIHLEPKRQDALWVQILARELGDRIAVKFQPYGGGVVITEDAYIEEIAETIDCRGSKIDWSFDLSLSPADTQSYWVLGDASNSLLGQTTFLAY